MQKKSQIIRRLNILYIVFFALVLFSIIGTFLSYDFKEGCKTGFNEGLQIMQVPEDISKNKTYMFLSIPISRKSETFRPESLSSPAVSSRTTHRDFKVSGENIRKPASFYLSGILGIFCYWAIFVLVFIILLSIRSSIRHNEVFNRNNIQLIRAVGLLLIVASLLYDYVRYTEIQQLIGLLGENNPGIIKSDIGFKDILIGILVLVIAEIFRIGYDITEEQKLTV